MVTTEGVIVTVCVLGLFGLIALVGIFTERRRFNKHIAQLRKAAEEGMTHHE